MRRGALEAKAGKLEAEAAEREDFHRNVGLPVVAAAAAIAAAPAKVVTLGVLGAGVAFGALFSFGRQVAEKIDGTRTQFSGLDVVSGAGWGGALAPATAAYAPVRLAMIGSGLVSGSSELQQGHTFTGWYDIGTSIVPESDLAGEGGQGQAGRHRRQAQPEELRDRRQQRGHGPSSPATRRCRPRPPSSRPTPSAAK